MSTTYTTRGLNRCDTCGRFVAWEDLTIDTWDEMVDEYGHVEEKGTQECSTCASPIESGPR